MSISSGLLEFVQKWLKRAWHENDHKWRVSRWRVLSYLNGGDVLPRTPEHNRVGFVVILARRSWAQVGGAWSALRGITTLI